MILLHVTFLSLGAQTVGAARWPSSRTAWKPIAGGFHGGPVGLAPLKCPRSRSTNLPRTRAEFPSGGSPSKARKQCLTYAKSAVNGDACIQDTCLLDSWGRQSLNLRNDRNVSQDLLSIKTARERHYTDPHSATTSLFLDVSSSTSQRKRFEVKPVKPETGRHVNPIPPKKHPLFIVSKKCLFVPIHHGNLGQASANLSTSKSTV